MSKISSIALIGAMALSGCASYQNDTPKAQAAASLDNARLARSDGSDIQSIGKLQVFALFTGPMPTGVTVSKSGRVFVNFPRWGDAVEFTVGEVKDGKVMPYPNLAINKLDIDNQTECLISVQSVVVDPSDRLWIVDTGSINMQPVKPGGPKLLCYDLKTNRLVKRIDFPADVVLPTTYLNDVRFNLNMGKAGVAFITDSSDKGPNGIIVVDLDSGTSWRKLNDHPSTKAEPNFTPIVEGQPLLARPGDGLPDANIKMGSDGIAISPDGKTLYYCALAAHHVYSVSTAALADGKLSDAETAKTVKDLGERDFASDGLICDMQGNLLLTDYEHNAIRRMTSVTGDAPAKFEIIAQDPRLIWPDTMSISSDNWLYVTANQLNRQKNYHGGKDLRQQPYVLFRMPLAQPRVATLDRGDTSEYAR